MRVSLDWLRSLCDGGLDAAGLAKRLVNQGLEVSAVWQMSAPCDRIVTARVTEIAQLPRTNLQCLVLDAGEAGQFNVVSAAPHLHQGMVGALALPGATLPDGRVIEAREYQGQASEAMLCAAAEIGLGEVSDRLLAFTEDTVLGQTVAELYGLPDTCLEVDLTPNRGDCWSMLGIAREVHAGTEASLQPPAVEPVEPSQRRELVVEVAEPAACPRYAGRVLTDIDALAVTPLWMSERLRRAGLRPTYPVVDVLNYVMLELGQPLHAFDETKLHGGLTVRLAEAGEIITLLGNDEAVELVPDMLVIADKHGPVAVAGVMGGEHSAVSATTSSIFIESAFFAPAAIRGRARRLGLATEAAHRYERGVDPDLAPLALERATALIVEICGARPGPVTLREAAQELPVHTPLEFRTATLRRLTGLDRDAEACAGIFRRLGFHVRTTGDFSLAVTAPSARFDIENEADLVEEVARIVGFDSIPAVAPARHLRPLRLDTAAPRNERLCALAATRGYDEALTMSFAAGERDAALAPAATAALELHNPLSAREAVLRRSLWPGLIDALAHNTARRAERVRLFEMGAVFAVDREQREHLSGVVWGPIVPEQWGATAQPADFFDIKSDVHALLVAAGVESAAIAYESSERAALANGRRARVRVGECICGEFGVLSPRLAAAWDIAGEVLLFEIDLDSLPAPRTVQATAVPRFPAVRRDLALVVKNSVSAAQLEDSVRRHGGPRLSAVRIFDVYAGEGIPAEARSIALGLIFQDFSRTLTDAEVDAAVSAIVAGLGEEKGAYVRS
ncbi:MAG: phenylalanine--tRNA ligase subunit beta [Gammaproteobacteria bacterium]